ncbi:beta transducin [Paraconiothyrium brasiliense]|uniref:Beta transducin n=1 Tax=Paraconiothyrium brasiliense TaxID=300254 RepID=A0ABR3RGD2_9PLEO
MGARKKAVSTMSTTTNALKVKRVIFKRTKVVKGVRALQRANSEKTWEVIKLKNGLLDMGMTPPWMIEIVKRNATESPLLRLPGEIRNKIWDYAMTGNIVNIHEDEDESRVDAETMEKVVVVCKGHTVGVVGEDNPVRWLSTRAEDKPRLPTAFRLCEVSRQIYAEIGTLAYSGSIFVFCSWDDEGELVKEWARSLAPAHKNAITDIAIDDMNFDCYLSDKHRIREVFHGLQRLHLNTNRVNVVNVCGRRDDERHRSLWVLELKRLEERLQKRISKREGGAVKLVWHENLVEDYDVWENTDDESLEASSVSSDDAPTNEDDTEDSGPKWNIRTQEDSDGEHETDYQVGAENDEAANSEGEESNEGSDNLDYDSDMLDIGLS